MIRKLILVVVICILLGYLYFFQRKNIIIHLTNFITDMTVKSPLNKKDTTQLVTSNDGTFQFSYPKDWTLADMTGPGGDKGKFGEILQTWAISSSEFIPAGAGEVQSNGVKITINIEDAAVDDINKVVECEMKATTCESIMINSQMYRKSVATFNTGVRHIMIGTVKDNKVYLASAFIADGDQKQLNEEKVEAIFNSFSFQ